jgi:CRISPR-associated endonuclease/helicase Cas3
MGRHQAISRKGQSLWGKLAPDRSNYWLPLWLHLADTGEIAKLLWDHWLPEYTKMDIAAGLEIGSGQPQDMKVAYARKVAIFMAAIHDIGKASPVFVSKASKVGFGDIIDEITSRGLPVSAINPAQARDFPHGLVGECILEQQGLDRSFAVIVGGHHGKPPDSAQAISHAEIFPSFTGIGVGPWEEVRRELLQLALDLSGLDRMPKGTVSVPAQVLLSGFLIMADWLASGQKYFPLLFRDYPCSALPSAEERAEAAWADLHLPVAGDFADDCAWTEIYSRRFQRTARPMQDSVVQVAVQAKDPGIFIIEAPMGEGKTEAALAVAEVMARRYGLSGVYFALPTQATSDGIFPRILDWIRALHPQDSRTVFLAHGKAGFNEDYAGIKLDSNIYDDEVGSGPWAQLRPAVIVNDWTCGRKKGLLADFVVGTIDQVLLAGLKSKHLALRHLGLANKVVILDECHAYDAYMNSYLDLVLSWLGAYHVPVVVLSATLPPHRRNELLKVYRSSWGSKQKKPYISRRAVYDACRTEPKDSPEDKLSCTDAYPLISYTDGQAIKEDMPQPSGRKLDVKTEIVDGDSLADRLADLLSAGGCAGVIRNTVKEAQATATLLEERFGTACVRLLHSRFLACDRVRKEKELRDLLGPGECQRPKKLIVVGTQVMEQSLDVDFDVLFTDICPLDLLLQRIGRLHRHDRKTLRPFKLREAVCFIMGIEGVASFEQGSKSVYGTYLLLKTEAFLPHVIHMPEDIVQLVRQAYEQGYEQEMKDRLCAAGGPVDIYRICDEALAEYKGVLEEKKSKAAAFQIRRPDKQKKSLIEWLAVSVKDDASGKRGEATVRDSTDSLEVLVVVKKKDGRFYTVPWLSEYADAPIDSTANNDLAKTIAGCRVSLPGYFTAKWNIDKVIKALEQIVLDNRLDDWYSSHWLDEELFLVLNESGEMQLLDKMLIYDERYGLSIKEQEG